MAEAAVPVSDDKSLVQFHTFFKLQGDNGLLFDQGPGCIA
jgi:hypothetical protein